MNEAKDKEQENQNSAGQQLTSLGCERAAGRGVGQGARMQADMQMGGQNRNGGLFPVPGEEQEADRCVRTDTRSGKLGQRGTRNQEL